MSHRLSTKSREDTRTKYQLNKEIHNETATSTYRIKNELLDCSEEDEEMEETNVKNEPYFWNENSHEEDANNWNNILDVLQVENNEDTSNNNKINNDSSNNNLIKVYDVENKCAVCKKTFSFQRDLVKHVQQSHPNDKAFRCRHCPTLFSKLKSISTHLKRCHADIADTFPCNYCSKSFFKKSLLERHKLTHSEYIRDQHLYKYLDDNNFSEISDDIYDRRKGKIYPIEDKCAICTKKFAPQKILVKHVNQTHPNDKAYKCLYCPTLFSKLKSVTTHYKRSHSKMPKKIACDVCGMSFYTNFLLDRHKRVHIEIRPFSCNQCDKTYKYRRNLLVHKKTHLRNISNIKQDSMDDEYCENDEFYDNDEHSQITEDDECDGNDDQNQLLNNECYDNDSLDLFKGDEYYENDDQDVLTNDDYYVNKDQDELIGNEEELNMDTNESPFKCYECGKVYKHKKSLRYHQKKHRKNNEPTETIIIDNTVGNESNVFNINTNTTYFIIDEFNTDTENFEDLENEHDFSSADFTNEYSYDEYMPENSESLAKISQNECGVCAKTFKCQQAVAKHLQRNHPEIEFFKCPYCDDNFYSLNSLSQHITDAKHIQKRNVCELCLKSFDRRSDLRRHKRTHTNERPYTCCICQKTFKQDCHLKRHHEVTHNAAKTFSFYCEVCSKGFTSIDILKHHMTVHDRERAYPCSVCKRSLKTRDEWEKHKANHNLRKQFDSEY